MAAMLVALVAIPALGDDEKAAPAPRILAWNDLGMHCMDPGYGVFALLPPYNTVNAQVLLNGKLVQTGAGLTVTYEAVPDLHGSLNTTSAGKTDFWAHVQDLFGVALPVDTGLAGYSMPGLDNTPQSVGFDGAWDWFHAEGIPLAPTDDAQTGNTYPMMRLKVRNASGQELASIDPVLPVSSEMDCSKCHASASSPYAKPASGWVFDPDEDDDYRLNVIRLHDEKQANDPLYASSLSAVGYNPAGLMATVQGDGVAVLCAACHASNALPGTGVSGVSPLTQALHGLHASVFDATGLSLDDVKNRAACYTCHPGSTTQCLRGAMGKAVAADGSLAMQCQSCHGSMTQVASPTRVGWLDQPSCQECHTGTATNNAGQIRFTSVFDDLGAPHVPADARFATNADVPAAGFDLYRFSSGHGGLQCSACHGSPHAIYPTSHENDNVVSLQTQGHVGTIVECQSCHGSQPSTSTGGPHGMHPIGASWIDHHPDMVEDGGVNQCRQCHAADLRGTVLSLSQADRMIPTKYGVKDFWRGYQVGCYDCHDGPNKSDPPNNKPPHVNDASASTPNDVPKVITLTGSDPNGDALAFRIVRQPDHGTVGLSGNMATYYPSAGYTGVDEFTFAARDAKADSNLGHATISVQTAACLGNVEAYGFGCPGTRGALPVISLSGCPTPGGNVTFEVKGALGGTNALMLFGTQPATTSLAAGCVLRVAPVLPFTPVLPLTGVGAGAGSLSLATRIPANSAPGTFTMQLVTIDPGVPNGYAMSNGLEVTIQ